MKMQQTVPKRRHMKFRRLEITQKKANNISYVKVMIFVVVVLTLESINWRTGGGWGGN